MLVHVSVASEVHQWRNPSVSLTSSWLRYVVQPLPFSSVINSASCYPGHQHDPYNKLTPPFVFFTPACHREEEAPEQEEPGQVQLGVQQGAYLLSGPHSCWTRAFLAPIAAG